MDAKKRGRRIANLASFIPRGLCYDTFRETVIVFAEPVPVCGVAVSVTCCELLELPPPPPHATIPKARHAANPSNNSQRLRRPAKTRPIAPNGSSVANRRPGFIRLPTVIAFPAAILTVTVAVAGVVPLTVTVAVGPVVPPVVPEVVVEIEQMVVGVQASCTVPVNPPDGVSVTVKVAGVPLVTAKDRCRWSQTEVGRRGCAAASGGS